jgi:hypothetical protein
VLLEGVEEVGEVDVIGCVVGGGYLVLEQSQSRLVRVDLLLLQEVIAAGSHLIIIHFNNTNRRTTLRPHRQHADITGLAGLKEKEYILGIII